MADIFISYSRKDSEFIGVLRAGLERHGLDAWGDWRIPASTNWRQEIFTAIDSADLFLFVLSPDSVHSKVAEEEIEHALTRNKRIVPLVYRPVEHRLWHPAMARLHSFVFPIHDPEDALNQLVAVINSERPAVRLHTRLLVRAIEWERTRRANNLLRGRALREAEVWLEEAALHKGPQPTALHLQYIHASQKAARRPLGAVAGISLALLLLVIGGAGLIILNDRTPLLSLSANVQGPMTPAEDSQLSTQEPGSIPEVPTVRVKLPLTASAPPARVPPTASEPGTLIGRIVYASDFEKQNIFQLYVMAAGGGIPLHLIAGSEHDGVPAWSPDGHWIAFASQRNGKSEIYKMRADGSQQTALGTNLPGWHPTWSPDGKQIAFSTSSDIQYPSAIYKMNADGTEQIPLSDTSAHDIDPSWSPDGQHIAFVSHDNDKDVIYTMNSDGSARIPLTNASANDGNPAWSPNGQQIAFQSDRDGGDVEIYAMNADGTEPKRLTNSPGYDLQPVWSPDGKYIAFESTRAGSFDIYVMQANGSQQRPLIAGPGYEADPAWGP